jgi:hypothetical protein
MTYVVIVQGLVYINAPKQCITEKEIVRNLYFNKYFIDSY